MNAEYIETIAGKTPVEVSHVFLSDGRRCWVPGYLSLDEARDLIGRAPALGFWDAAAAQVRVFRGNRFGMWFGLPAGVAPRWSVMTLVLNRYGIAIDHHGAGVYQMSGNGTFGSREDAMRYACHHTTHFDVPATLVVLDDGSTDVAGMADVRDAFAALSSEGGE